MNGFWIGLVAYNNTYNWQWLDGTPVNYFNWGEDAPDQYRFQDFYIDQLCAMLLPYGITSAMFHATRKCGFVLSKRIFRSFYGTNDSKYSDRSDSNGILDRISVNGRS
jgi:hypothetical protein